MSLGGCERGRSERKNALSEGENASHSQLGDVAGVLGGWRGKRRFDDLSGINGLEKIDGCGKIRDWGEMRSVGGCGKTNAWRVANVDADLTACEGDEAAKLDDLGKEAKEAKEGGSGKQGGNRVLKEAFNAPEEARRLDATARRASWGAAIFRPLRRCGERFWGSRLARRLAGGFFWLSVASFAARLGTLISVILVARILGNVAYGELSLIRATVNGFVVLASFGMGRTATKHVAELAATDKERAGRVIALNYVFSFISSVVVAAFFCWAAPWLFGEAAGAPRLVPQARLSSILLILSAFVSAQAGVMSGLQAFRGLAIATAASGLGSIPFFVLGAYWGGVSGAILGFASGSFLNYLINGAFIYFQLKNRGIRYHFGEFWQERAILWNFCLPQTLTSVTTGLIGTAATMMLAAQKNGIAEVAVFEAARQIQTSILYLPNMATQVLLPTLTEFNALKNRTAYLKALKYNALANIVLSLSVALVVSAAAPWIMRAFGEGFEGGVATLALLLVVGVIMSVCNVCASALTSLGAVWSGFFLNAIWGVAFLIGARRATAAEGGAFGLAVASLVAYSIYLLCCVGFIKRRLSLRNEEKAERGEKTRACG